MAPRRGGRVVAWAYIGAALLFLYVPLVPPLLYSVAGEQGAAAVTLRWYRELGDNPLLMGGVQTSVALGLIVGAITPVLALLAAMAVREMRARRLIVLFVLLPLFIPGVSMGLATAVFFRALRIPPSLATIAVVHVLWALPFAFLIILAVMATFDPVYLEAAYLHGANRLRAFLDVELPLIRHGILGAAIFSLILSFNETVRTALVQGPLNTVQTYIWSTFLQVGLSPTLYALMSLLIVLTLGLVGALLLVGARGAVTPPAEPRPRG
jgi:ABC-type spermidine/putrescine transport system permease subunit II